MRFWITLAALGATLLAVPSDSLHAQVWKRIKEQAKQKVTDRAVQAAGEVVTSSGEVVDSAVEKTGRGVDSAVTKAAAAADTVMNRTEQSVAGVFTGSDTETNALAAKLDEGRAVVAGINFAPGSDELQPSSKKALKRLVQILEAREGPYLIESHLSAGGDAAAEQALSDRRAAAVKARLVAGGIAEARLFSVGLGSTRPPTASAAGARPEGERIEVSRMQ